MTLFMVFQEALRSLGRNVLRSALTALGIIIGVGAFIVMVAIGTGAKTAVEAQIASLGSNVVIVFPSFSLQTGVRSAYGATTLSADDAKAIGRECPSVEAVSPSLRASAQAVYEDRNWSTAVYGGNTEYLAVRNWVIAAGRNFSAMEVEGSSKVCLIGSVAANELFGGQDPIGQVIRVQKIPFRVIGLLSPKGQSAFGSDQDDLIVAPYTTLQKRVLGTTRVSSIIASARSAGDTDKAVEEITALLRQRHHIPPNGDEDFNVGTQAEIAETAGETSRIMLLLLGSVAAVSLVVGGIGIMNIMLVSVTERTREIGIRMAVGAQGRDILLQFVMEAVSLSVVGGLVGALLGIGAAVGISSLVGWPVVVDPGAVLLSVGFAGLVGIVFGLYPAMKASALDPIEALRYE